MQRFRRACVLALAFSAALLWACSTSREAAAEVWSGYTKSFTKPDGSSYMLPENQDMLTPGVILTRGDIQGLFNFATEPNYLASVSPEFTEWATSINNPGQSIVATNFANLVYDTWVDAYGGQGTHNLPTSLTTHDAVVHLINYDVYLDLRFTSWTQGDGGFSYLRAEPHVVTTGDYNGDHVVNAADYTLWRDTYGKTVTPGAEADGSGNGTIDDPDFTFWKNHFNNPAPGAGAGGVGSQEGVPEPATLMLIGSAIAGLGLRAAGRGAIFGDLRRLWRKR